MTLLVYRSEAITDNLAMNSTAEFPFVSGMPKSTVKDRLAFVEEVNSFMAENPRGIVPVVVAAQALGVSGARVRQMVIEGKLDAIKPGGVLLVSVADIEVQMVAPKNKGGRPRKEA